MKNPHPYFNNYRKGIRVIPKFVFSKQDQPILIFSGIRPMVAFDPDNPNFTPAELPLPQDVYHNTYEPVMENGEVWHVYIHQSHKGIENGKYQYGKS